MFNSCTITEEMTEQARVDTLICWMFEHPDTSRTQVRYSDTFSYCRLRCILIPKTLYIICW